MVHNPYKYFVDNFPRAELAVPQNVINIIKELGENSVIFFLFLLTRNSSWKVFKNLNEVGCDIILNKGDTVVKVEVKTRQNIHSRNKRQHDNSVQFELTALEYVSCDFIVGLWFNRNAYFILTKDQLVKSTSKGKTYRIVIREERDGDDYVYRYGKKDHRQSITPNRWEILHDHLKKLDKKKSKKLKL